MARQEAKPQGRREAGLAARGLRGRPGARWLGGVGGGAACCPGVKGSGPPRDPGAAASQEAPPPLLLPLLLGLLLLAALPGHCLANPGKHLAAALRSRRFLEERGRPSEQAPGGWRWRERSLQHPR